MYVCVHVCVCVCEVVCGGGSLNGKADDQVTDDANLSIPFGTLIKFLLR